MMNNPFLMQTMNIEMDNNKNENEDSGFKYNVEFRNYTGFIKNIVADEETTIKEVIKIFLKRIGKNELIDSKKVSFCYSADIVDINNEKKVKDFFRNNTNPKIYFEGI